MQQSRDLVLARGAVAHLFGGLLISKPVRRAKHRAEGQGQWMPRLFSVARSAAVCCWFLLTVLSLLPGPLRPHALSSGNLEHLSAYGVAAFLTQVGFVRLDSRWQVAGFSAMAAAFELGQLWIPGRHFGVDNWAASTLGAVAGTILARMVLRLPQLSRAMMPP